MPRHFPLPQFQSMLFLPAFAPTTHRGTHTHDMTHSHHRPNSRHDGGFPQCAIAAICGAVFFFCHQLNIASSLLISVISPPCGIWAAVKGILLLFGILAILYALIIASAPVFRVFSPQTLALNSLSFQKP